MNAAASDPYRIIISNAALKELQAVFDYLAARSPQGASAVVERVLEAIDGLDLMPARYKVVGRSRRTSDPIHSFAVPPLLVYYKIDERLRAVSVLMVRHGSRRQPRRFE